MNEAMATGCLLGHNFNFYLRIILREEEKGMANYAAECAGLWQKPIDICPFNPTF